ncbi:hypothetical protein Anas_08776, partial [Armadillidium nasatum]
ILIVDLFVSRMKNSSVCSENKALLELEFVEKVAIVVLPFCVSYLTPCVNHNFFDINCKGKKDTNQNEEFQTHIKMLHWTTDKSAQVLLIGILSAFVGLIMRVINPGGKAVLITGCDTGIGHKLAFHLEKLVSLCEPTLNG